MSPLMCMKVLNVFPWGNLKESKNNIKAKAKVNNMNDILEEETKHLLYSLNNLFSISNNISFLTCIWEKLVMANNAFVCFSKMFFNKLDYDCVLVRIV